jgi:hypothetical protein
MLIVAMVSFVPRSVPLFMGIGIEVVKYDQMSNALRVAKIYTVKHFFLKNSLHFIVIENASVMLNIEDLC